VFRQNPRWEKNLNADTYDDKAKIIPVFSKVFQKNYLKQKIGIVTFLPYVNFYVIISNNYKLISFSVTSYFSAFCLLLLNNF